MKTRNFLAVLMSLLAFVACKGPEEPEVGVIPKEMAELIGRWTPVHICRDEVIDAVSTLSLDLTEENVKVLPESRVEITVKADKSYMWADGKVVMGTLNGKSTREFGYRIVARSYLLLTNDDGEVMTYRRAEVLPAVENKARGFVGTWRFASYLEITDRNDTVVRFSSDDFKDLGHYLEIEPYEEVGEQTIAPKHVDDDEPETRPESLYNYTFVSFDVLSERGTLHVRPRKYELDNVGFMNIHSEVTEIPWEEKPWSEIDNHYPHYFLGHRYELRGARADTLRLYNNGCGFNAYVYIGE